jgi:alpha-ketoglutarate-dependent taurine dioxygenase
MTFSARPLSDQFGIEILALDLSKPMDEATFRRFYDLWMTYAIIVVRDQTMSPDDHVAFTKRLGEIEAHNLDQWALPERPEVFVISNVQRNGRHIGAPKAGRHWHTDTHYLEEPSKGSFMVAREVPAAEGDTLFADMGAAYGALDEDMKGRIQNLEVLVSRVKAYPISYPDRDPMTAEQIAKLPDVVQPLVRTHPETRRPSLFMGGNVVWEVLGMPFDEGRALIKQLREFCTQERFVYTHKWLKGDAVLWDNRRTMHCATSFDETRYRRVMHRTTIRGDKPFFQAT